MGESRGASLLLGYVTALIAPAVDRVETSIL